MWGNKYISIYTIRTHIGADSTNFDSLGLFKPKSLSTLKIRQRVFIFIVILFIHICLLCLF